MSPHTFNNLINEMENKLVFITLTKRVQMTFFQPFFHPIYSRQEGKITIPQHPKNIHLCISAIEIYWFESVFGYRINVQTNF